MDKPPVIDLVPVHTMTGLVYQPADGQDLEPVSHGTFVQVGPGTTGVVAVAVMTLILLAGFVILLLPAGYHGGGL